MGRVATYVIDLLDSLLGERAERERRFPWAVGDLSPKTRRCVELPFDAVWESRKLIVEVDEDQHRGPMPFWDKDDVLTVSGVPRGKQRRIYDQHKRQAARDEGYLMLEIPWERRPPPDRRQRETDLQTLRQMLSDAGIEL